jgi:parallel beta-helix repeat protein
MKKIMSATMLAIIIFSTVSVQIRIGEIGQIQAQTEPSEDVLIISSNYTKPGNISAMEAYFGLYSATNMPATGWNLLKNTIDWATKHNPPQKIMLFYHDGSVNSPSSNNDAMEVHSKLSSWGYGATATTLQPQSAAETLLPSDYSGYDLVIYWDTYGYYCANIVQSGVPFITCSAMQTDEMHIGTGVTTLHEFENTFYLVHRCWPTDSPTSPYSTDKLALFFESNMWLDTAEAANYGIALVTTEEPLIYVSSISMSAETEYGGTWARVKASVTVHDTDGNSPIVGAKVTGHWTGKATNFASGQTVSISSSAPGGVATLYSDWADNPEGKFTFTIDEIEKEGRAYAPSLNVQTDNYMNVYIVNMVFVNGWNGKATDMANVVTAIGNDLAAYAQSNANTFVEYNYLNKDYGNNYLADWASVIDQNIEDWDTSAGARHKNLILVGHSFGGKAIIYAVDHTSQLKDYTKEVVTINSPIKPLLYYYTILGMFTSEAVFITWVGAHILGFKMLEAAWDAMTYDSTTDAQNIVSDYKIEWLAFVSGEEHPAEIGTDNWGSPFSFLTLLFPWDMTDGFLPMQAEFLPGVSDTVYYGVKNHCALGSDPDAYNTIAENIVNTLFGTTIEVVQNRFDPGSVTVVVPFWRWFFPPYYKSFVESGYQSGRSFYLLQIEGSLPLGWLFWYCCGIPYAGWDASSSIKVTTIQWPPMSIVMWFDYWIYYQDPVQVKVLEDPPRPSISPVNSTVTQVGVAGGTVSLESANLTIPPGALSTTVNVTVDTFKNPWVWNGSLPEYGDVVGYIYRFGPQGLNFNKPVNLTIGYNETAVTNENLLAVLMYNYTTGKWQRTGATIDKATHTASLTITHFSTFALAQMRDADGDGIPDDIDNWPWVYNPDQAMVTPKNDLYINSNTLLKPGTYNIADSGAKGVLIINASNIILDCNGATINGTGSGMCICNPGFENVTILNCNVANYQYGIALNTSSNNAIMNSIVESNGYGIFVQSSNCGCVFGNHIQSNGYGIYLSSSINNTIIDNYFNNTKNAWVNGKNNWNMTYRIMAKNIVGGLCSGGNYWSDYTGVDEKSGPYQNETGSDGIGDTPYFINANNTDEYPLMTLKLLAHDVAVTGVLPSKTVVGRGYSLKINVTLENQGNYTETFNVTVYANTTSIGSQTITLTSGASTTITFTWNTTDIPYGNYTISAYATPVPSETNITNNIYTDGWVVVTIPGDINGDRVVDSTDQGILGVALGSTIGKPNYISEADINGDGVVDSTDLGILGVNWGHSW